MQSVIDLAVVGGGAAGLACALKGGQLGLKVILLEKTEQCGKKLALTGGKRCNFTHLEPPELIVKRFDGPREKLLPLLRRLPPPAVIAFFREVGIEPRVDSAGCIWPKWMTAGELRDGLVQAVLLSGVEIKLSSAVQEIKPGWLIVLKTGATIEAKNVVVATGGASYPQTGSTGDGNGLVQPLGISTTPFFPALAALKPKLNLKHLAGVTQPLVEVRVNLPNVFPKRGSFLFAHEFLSGSAVMNISGFVARALMQGLQVEIEVDWVPEKKREELKLYFLRLRTERPLLQVKSALGIFVARRVAAFICSGADVAAERRLSELKKTELNRLIEWLKGTSFEIVGTEPIGRATVTGGGVNLNEIDLKTMAAVRFPGLFIVGEALDVWAETGGYNLHFAWVSGIVAAQAVAQRVKGGLRWRILSI